MLRVTLTVIRRPGPSACASSVMPADRYNWATPARGRLPRRRSRPVPVAKSRCDSSMPWPPTTDSGDRRRSRPVPFPKPRETHPGNRIRNASWKVHARTPARSRPGNPRRRPRTGIPVESPLGSNPTRLRKPEPRPRVGKNRAQIDGGSREIRQRPAQDHQFLKTPTPWGIQIPTAKSLIPGLVQPTA